MTNCPLCGSSLTYVGTINVECSNSHCSNYAGGSLTNTPFMVAWVTTMYELDSEPYWASEVIEPGQMVSLVSFNEHADGFMVRRYAYGDVLLGTCDKFEPFANQIDALEAMGRA